MGADEYLDCPCCDGEESVRMDNVKDYTLYGSGAIISDMHGVCLACGRTFKVNHRTWRRKFKWTKKI